MSSRPSRNASRPRRSTSSTRSPPPRRARMTAEDEQVAKTISQHISGNPVDDSQESQPSSSIPAIPSQPNGRRPRITAQQKRELSDFSIADAGNKRATLEEKQELATRLNLQLSQVNSWFARTQRRDHEERLEYMREMGELDTFDHLAVYRERREEQERERLPAIREANRNEERNSFDNPEFFRNNSIGQEGEAGSINLSSTLPCTSAQVGVSGGSRRHRMLLRDSSPLSLDDPMDQGENSLATRNEPGAQGGDEAELRRELDRLNRFLEERDLAAIRDSQNEIERPITSVQAVVSGSARRHRIYFPGTFDQISRELEMEEETQLPESNRPTVVIAAAANTAPTYVPQTAPRNQLIDYQVVPDRRLLRDLLLEVNTHPITPRGQRIPLPDQQITQKNLFSLPPTIAIPRDILHSFGPEGLKDDDDEEVTDIEEMVFQKLLRKKMVCEICLTHMKQFRCSKCFYSMCKICTDTIAKEHTGPTPCPQCRTKQFLPIILPRL